MPLNAGLGVAKIQHTLFGMQADAAAWHDVLEVSVKAESAATAQKLLQAMVGTYLPKETLVQLRYAGGRPPSREPLRRPDPHVQRDARADAHARGRGAQD